MIVVSLSLATICFMGECHPALVGKDTPVGGFKVQQRIVASEGYGGDVLSFTEDEKGVYAIHRVWTRRPGERRMQRLASSKASDRQTITNGCINVAPAVYEQLVRCCSSESLRVVP